MPKTVEHACRACGRKVVRALCDCPGSDRGFRRSLPGWPEAFGGLDFCDATCFNKAWLAEYARRERLN